MLHPGTTAFLIAFAQNIVGIILPTLACALLLQTSLLESIPEYFEEDLHDASFSFGTSSLLLIELIKSSGKRPGFRWSLGVGIFLLGAILLVSSGLAVNQIIVKDFGFKAESEFAPWVNFIFAVGGVMLSRKLIGNQRRGLCDDRGKEKTRAGFHATRSRS